MVFYWRGKTIGFLMFSDFETPWGDRNQALAGGKHFGDCGFSIFEWVGSIEQQLFNL